MHVRVEIGRLDDGWAVVGFCGACRVGGGMRLGVRRRYIRFGIRAYCRSEQFFEPFWPSGCAYSQQSVDQNYPSPAPVYYVHLCQPSDLALHVIYDPAKLPVGRNRSNPIAPPLQLPSTISVHLNIKLSNTYSTAQVAREATAAQETAYFPANQAICTNSRYGGDPGTGREAFWPSVSQL